MPHIDDGILHAYLDGALDAVAEAGELPDDMSAADVLAHFEQCSDCRARLEAERDVRERAGMVLRDAAPASIHAPPFTPAAQVPLRARRTWVPMAWAASLLLAVGAGWWGSQISSTRDTGQAVLDSYEAPATAAQRTQSGQEAMESAPGSQMTMPAPEAVMQAPVAASPQPSSDVANREAADALVARQAAPFRTDGATAARAANEESVMMAPAAPPPPPPAAATTDVRLEPQGLPLGLAAGVAVEMPFDAQLITFLARDSAGEVVWRTLTEDDWRRSRATALAIADERVIMIEEAADVGVIALRVRHRLASGDTVEIMTWQKRHLALDEIVVTGSAAQAPPPPARAAAAAQNKPLMNLAERSVSRPTPRSGTERAVATFMIGERWVVLHAAPHVDIEDLKRRVRALPR